MVNILLQLALPLAAILRICALSPSLSFATVLAERLLVTSRLLDLGFLLDDRTD